MTGYDTCTACCFGHHGSCDGYARIFHVGSYVPEVVPCVCSVCHRCYDNGHAACECSREEV